MKEQPSKLQIGSTGMPLVISLVLCVLIGISSGKGLDGSGLYAGESLNWQAQSIGQDIFNLVIACPILLISAAFLYFRRQAAMQIWLGTIAYLIYTYVIYCFDLRLNSMFLVYCIILGTSSYSLIYFLPRWLTTAKTKAIHRTSKFSAVYCIIIASMFALLWLSELIPATLSGVAPVSLSESGLPTNPVQVLDLSLLLPAIFLTGMKALRGNLPAERALPVVLWFCVLMSASIAVLQLVMIRYQQASSMAVATAMFLLAAVAAVLLILQRPTN